MDNVALGTVGVVVALVASVLGGFVTLTGVIGKRPALVGLSKWYALAVFLGIGTAVFAMQRALITRDFTVEYVANNGSSKTPPLFNVATMWSALEGSILLWAVLLAAYLLAMAVRYRRRTTDALVGWAMIVMFAVCTFFAGLMMGPADPFVRVAVKAGFDGPGPNPLLQNHILVAFHPPLLYLGYVGFTVPFAFAIGALVTGRLDEGWLYETRRWTLLSWAALTGGIVLGAWWSYEVLGWGGYWAWDPVENASFLPWLTGTAYIHSVLVQERRKMLRVWNLALLCATFSLTILGTFLTRSGVVASVHAFSNSAMGPLLLGFFALIVVVSVGLIGWRGDQLRAPGRIDSPLSREAAFLANNVVFAVFTLVVLLGTVFPLLIEAVRGQQIAVGEPYFDRMATPLGLCLLTLMAVAPVLPWRSTNVETLSQRLWWPGWCAVGAGVVALFVGATGVVALLGFVLGGFAAGSACRQLVLATRRNGIRGLFGRVNGGMVVHLGTIIVAVALTAAGTYERRGEFEVKPGETVTVAGHNVTYRSSQLVETKLGPQTRFEVDIDGETHHPAVTRYESRAQIIGTPSVKVNITGDVYVSVPGVPDSQNAAITMRVVVLPLATWLWIGGIIMVVGTAFAFIPGVRKPTDPVSAPSAMAKRSGRGHTSPAPVSVSATIGADPPHDASPVEEVSS